MLKVNLKLDQATQKIENATALAIRMLMEDIHQHSTPITPKSAPPNGGSLRAAVSKTMPGKMRGVMIWNVPYAQYQERGMTATGQRPVRNYTTPGTHAGFVEESVKGAMTRLPQYLKMGGLI